MKYVGSTIIMAAMLLLAGSDINNDGVVDLKDYAAFQNDFGGSVCIKTSTVIFGSLATQTDVVVRKELLSLPEDVGFIITDVNLILNGGTFDIIEISQSGEKVVFGYGGLAGIDSFNFNLQSGISVAPGSSLDIEGDIFHYTFNGYFYNISDGCDTVVSFYGRSSGIFGWTEHVDNKYIITDVVALVCGQCFRPSFSISNKYSERIISNDNRYIRHFKTGIVINENNINDFSFSGTITGEYLISGYIK